MVSKRVVTEKINMLINLISGMTDISREYVTSSMKMHREFTNRKIKALEERIQKLEEVKK